MNRQKLVLFIVVIVLALAIVWSFISFPREKTVASSKRTPVKAQAVVKAPAASVDKISAPPAKADARPALTPEDRTLRLDLLEREQTGFKGYKRNIFKPVFTDEMKLMKQKAAAVKPIPVQPVPVVPRPLPVQPTPPPPPPEDTVKSSLARFTFLGFLKKDNKRTIFLSKDKEIILVRKGETFAKRYEATAITDQALTIRVTDSGEEIVIPLTENKPLSAAAKK
jgi:hypothetical protein